MPCLFPATNPNPSLYQILQTQSSCICFSFCFWLQNYSGAHLQFLEREREREREVGFLPQMKYNYLVSHFFEKEIVCGCLDLSARMLVYEYVDNGNLEQWLHGPLAESNPLTWEARMRIVLGTAKA